MKLNRRNFLKTIAGAAVLGAAGVEIPEVEAKKEPEVKPRTVITMREPYPGAATYSPLDPGFYQFNERFGNLWGESFLKPIDERLSVFTKEIK